MGDVRHILRPESLVVNPLSTRFFRSMYDARHLGRLPLPLGEGWGEGSLAHSISKLSQPFIKGISANPEPAGQMGDIPPGRLQLPIQILGIIQIHRQRLR